MNLDKAVRAAVDDAFGACALVYSDSSGWFCTVHDSAADPHSLFCDRSAELASSYVPVVRSVKSYIETEIGHELGEVVTLVNSAAEAVDNAHREILSVRSKLAEMIRRTPCASHGVPRCVDGFECQVEWATRSEMASLIDVEVGS